LLDAYATWLVDEAGPSGGIGPGESTRVWQRHIADALSFAAALPAEARGRLADVGSGVGLPGIPLAIAFPSLNVVLIDRSGRRVDLARRAVRVLEIANVEVVHADIDDVETGWDFVTMRAFAKLERTVVVGRRLLRRGGIGVIGMSRVTEPRDEEVVPLGSDVAVLAVPPDVLDSPGWLLTIRP
jgi:16S rRNA (guanine(527)-N(7))-methyltransferase RsmG